MAGIEGTLPHGHEDQIQLGVRIIVSAHENIVQRLEQEIKGLRLTCDEQRGTVANLQRKTSALEVELVEGHQRSQQLAEENKELFRTVGSLRKQLGRLEHLKSTILSSVQEDDEKLAELGDVKAITSEDYISSATPLTASYATGGFRALTSAGSLQPAPGTIARSVLHEPRVKQGQLPLNPGGYGSGAMSPAGSVASNGEIDGKAFFRHARGKLSYEGFNKFLQSIKRLNSQQQTREETLDEAKRIFGPQLTDLYIDFENMLNRQAGPSP